MLSAKDGYVEVAGAAHIESGSVHALVGFKQGIAQLEVEIARFPRRAEFVVVLQDVLVDSVKGEGGRAAGAADSCFEAVVGGRGVVGEDAAIAPAADAEFGGIGDAHSDNVIDRTEQIDDFL